MADFILFEEETDGFDAIRFFPKRVLSLEKTLPQGPSFSFERRLFKDFESFTLQRQSLGLECS